MKNRTGRENNMKKRGMTGIGARLFAGLLTLAVFVCSLPDIEFYQTDDGQIGLEVASGPLEVKAATTSDEVWHVTDLSDWNTTYTSPVYTLDEYIGSAKRIIIPSKMVDSNGRPVLSELRSFGSSESAKNLEGIVVDSGVNTTGEDGKNIFDGIRGNGSKLKYMDLSGLDISALTDLRDMFKDLPALEYLNISGFNPKNVNHGGQVSLSNMFQNDTSLHQLDLTGFDTSNVRDASGMFEGCSNLEAIYADASFDLRGITNPYYHADMFTGCTKLKGWKGTPCDGSNNTNKTYARVDGGPGAEGYFSGVMTITDWGNDPGDEDYRYTIDKTNHTVTVTALHSDAWDTYYNIAIPGQMEIDDGSGTETYNVILSKSLMCYRNAPVTANIMILDGVKTTAEANQMFSSLPDTIRDVDVSRLDTSDATNMEGMFCYNQCIDRIHFGKAFDTSEVTNMCAMFACDGSTPSDIFIKSLDLSFFNTSKVENMGEMFMCEYALTDLVLGSFDTSNVTHMGRMFQDCDMLETLDLSAFDTGNVENMENMFARIYDDHDDNTDEDVSHLKTIYVSSSFDTTKVNISTDMFLDCKNLVGGAGTTYDSARTDKEYARVDGGVGAEGYFTLKERATVPDAEDWNYEVDGSGKYVILNGYQGSDTDVTIPATMLSSKNKKLHVKLKSVKGTTGQNIVSLRTETTTSQSGITEYVLATDADTDTGGPGMFEGLEELTSLDLSGFDYSGLTSCKNMFKDCSELVTLDLSLFDTANITSMEGMFSGCSNLETIYASDHFVTVTNSVVDVFDGCSALVGGRGTVYDGNHTDLTYARIDRRPNKPGYFTLKDVKPAKTELPGWTTTALSDWNYDVSGSDVKLNQYKGRATRILIPATFDVGGETKDTVLNSFGSGVSTSELEAILVLDGVRAGENAKDMLSGCKGSSSNLIYADLSGLDTSGMTLMNGMFQNLPILEYLNISGFDTQNVTNMGYMFSGDNSLVQLDLTSFDTTGVTETLNMFDGCSSLEAIYVDGSGFSMSQVTNATEMFQDCNSLKGWKGTACDGNTNIGKSHARVDDPGTSNPGYFSGISILSDWEDDQIDPSYSYIVDDIHHTITLKTIRESCLDKYVNLAVPARMYPASASGSGYYDVILGGLVDHYFTGSSPKLRNVMILDGVRATDNAGYLFYNMPDPITNLDVSRLDTSDATSMNDMFSYNMGLEHITFGRKFDTSNVTDMISMFEESSGLMELDLRGFDTGQIDCMTYMFKNCSGLSSLNLSGFNTGTVRVMSELFQGCSSLTSLDLSDFDTSNTEYMDEMFKDCSSLQTVVVSRKFVTTKLSPGSGNGRDMFAGCTNIKGGKGTDYDVNHTDEAYARIDNAPRAPGYFASEPVTVADAADWNYQVDDDYVILDGYKGSSATVTVPSTMVDSTGKTLKVKLESVKGTTGQNITSLTIEKGVKGAAGATGMFAGLSLLDSLDLSGLDISELRSLDDMFNGCSSLTTLDLSGFNTEEITSMNRMFSGCANLQTINVSRYFTVTSNKIGQQMFNGCNALTGEKGTKITSINASAIYGTVNEAELARIDGGDDKAPGLFTEMSGSGKTVAPSYAGSELSYSFINNFAGLKYEDTYRIPKERYEQVYGNKGDFMHYFYDDEWGGSCYGLSTSSALINVPKNGVELKDYSDAESVNKYVVKVSGAPNNTDNVDDLKMFIEQMQISQYDVRVQLCYILNTGINDTVKAMKSEPYPMILGLFGPEGGHAVLAYSVEDVSSTEAHIHIYDSNWPGEDCYVTAKKKNGSDTYNFWEYDLGGREGVNSMIWGTERDVPAGEEPCEITFIPYDVYSTVYMDQGYYNDADWLIGDEDDGSWSEEDEEEYLNWVWTQADQLMYNKYPWTEDEEAEYNEHKDEYEEARREVTDPADAWTDQEEEYYQSLDGAVSQEQYDTDPWSNEEETAYQAGIADQVSEAAYMASAEEYAHSPWTPEDDEQYDAYIRAGGENGLDHNYDWTDQDEDLYLDYGAASDGAYSWSPEDEALYESYGSAAKADDSYTWTDNDEKLYEDLKQKYGSALPADNNYTWTDTDETLYAEFKSAPVDDTEYDWDETDEDLYNAYGVAQDNAYNWTDEDEKIYADLKAENGTALPADNNYTWTDADEKLYTEFGSADDDTYNWT
ncbi:MAG: BspA family leucine-rich repeat surface protein, partial [Lachnospiraceae bacterium]|nr:BspA family leucine-rich repeat surface protein [Lachnospiraceae bacterium]